MENNYYNNSNKKIILILIILNGDVICATSVVDSWILFSKALKDSWTNCPVHLGTFECLKHSSLEVFDKMIKSDVIPLTEDVRLERKISLNKAVDKQIIQPKVRKRSDTYLEKESEYWSVHILKRILNLFKTHTLNVDLARRRHRNQMLPMMIFGVTALGVFTIPMGFQFLSVLGGKALLLSKMALTLAIINGFKRVANSGVHYGLYHTDQHHGYHYLDRGDTNRPRSTKM